MFVFSSLPRPNQTKHLSRIFGILCLVWWPRRRSHLNIDYAIQLHAANKLYFEADKRSKINVVWVIHFNFIVCVCFATMSNRTVEIYRIICFYLKPEFGSIFDFPFPRFFEYFTKCTLRHTMNSHIHFADRSQIAQPLEAKFIIAQCEWTSDVASEREREGARQRWQDCQRQDRESKLSTWHIVPWAAFHSITNWIYCFVRVILCLNATAFALSLDSILKICAQMLSPIDYNSY